jgi:hypothetical protein
LRQVDSARQLLEEVHAAETAEDRDGGWKMPAQSIMLLVSLRAPSFS